MNLSDGASYTNCDSSEVDREQRDKKERSIQMRRNTVTSGFAGRLTKRSMVGVKESSRCGPYAAKEYECHLSWILKQKENYENVESTEWNW
jgi:hypothetical protein